MAARIDRLAPEDKRLLQSAAVIGKDVPLVLLQAIADGDEEAVRGALTHLQSGEFLYETSLFPDVEYTFKHALTHEVAYGSLLQDRRRSLHARIVETIERQYAHRLAEQVDRLAHHAVRGEVWPKALTYLRQAGAKATARSAYRETVTCLEQALAALAHLPESHETIMQAIDLRLELRGALLPLGQNQKALDYLRPAEGLAAGLDDRSRLARVLASECVLLRVTLQYDRAIEAGERALTIATALGDLDLQAIARYGLGQTFFILGDYVRARDFLRWVVDALEQQVASQTAGLLTVVTARCWLMRTLRALGQFVEGISHGEQAIRIAESGDRWYEQIIAGTTLGELYVMKGDLDRAIPLLERSLALAQTWNILNWVDTATGMLGQAYALSERYDEAFRLLRETLELDTQVYGGVNSSRVLQLGGVYLLAGHPAEASERARQALELSRHRKQRAVEAGAFRLLGQAASDRDRFQPAEAEAYYRQALTLDGELGMRPLVAHCHLDLGTLCRRTGKRQEAREHLTTATTMYREMGMTYWVEKAEGEMKDLA